MKCIVCKQGDTLPGFMTATLEQGTTTVIFKGVPADICQCCGEEYLSSDTSHKLLLQAEEAVKRGVQIDVRLYQAA